MKWTIRLAAFAASLALPLPSLAAPIKAVMHKNPTCTCCETYAAYLEQNGFEVELRPTNDLTQISATAGVPDQLQGCHTIMVGGYVVACFVPVNLVKKMLKEGPGITGISLPGMPAGSPGMGGAKTEPFTVYAFLVHGETTVYAVE